jgi:hypothetical protein
MAESEIRPDSVLLHSEETTISPQAVALLEFTSDFRVLSKRGQLAYITSKGAYIWAAAAVLIAQYSRRRVDDLGIQTAIYTSVVRNIESVSHSNNLPSFDHKNKSVQYVNEASVSYSIVNSLLLNINLPKMGEQHYLDEIIQSGYAELLGKALIVDPVIETTLGLAILSLVPFSFVKRTKRGQLEYQKIQAAAWKYEWSRKRGGDVQTNLTFEVARIAKALKVGIVAAYHHATSSEGDEPEDVLPDASA